MLVLMFNSQHRQASEIIFQIMEHLSSVTTPNRIQISPFGLQYLRKLPQDIEDLQESETTSHDNMSINQPHPYLRGKSLDFRKFASQTQQLLFRQTSSLIKARQMQTFSTESKRKLQLHHQNWQSQQRLISHKLMDIQSKLNHQRYNEYDWQSVNSILKQSSNSILSRVDKGIENRKMRTRDKLKRLLVKKYPNRLEQ